VSSVDNGAGYIGSFATVISDPATGDGTGSIDWTFTVNDSLVDHLAVGETIVQSYDVTVDDGNGGTDTETVTITITGTNDAPIIGAGDTSGAVTELPDGDAGENTADLTDTGSLAFTDVDLTDSHTVSSVDNGAGYLGTFGAVINGGDIDWTFTVNDSLLDGLAAGETVVQSYDVTVDDGNGGTDTETVTITITGTNEAPVITGGDSTGGVTEIVDLASGENIDDLTDSGSLTFTDEDIADTHTVSSVDNGIGYIGSFGAVVGAGSVDWTFTVNDSLVDYLAVGETIVQSYDVTVDDGNGGTDTETVTITITGTNDAPVITGGDTTGGVTEIADGATGENTDNLTDSGSLAFTDVDLIDTHTVSDVDNGAGYIGSFDTVINGSDVDWTFTVNDSLLDGLAAGETIVQSYDVTVDDGNGGTDTETVTITITGTNDAPVIGAGDTTGSVTELPDGDAGENTADLTDTGTLPFTDVDITDTHTVSSVENGAGYLGSFAAVINGSDIDWTFTVNDSVLDGLAAGEQLVQSYDVTVDDGNGGTDTETVTITITGTNEAPVITGGDATGDVTEIADGAPGENVDDLTDSGSLSFSDGDVSDTHTASSVANGIGYVGAFNAVINGGNIDWDFSVNDSLVDHLGDGETIVQSYDVTVDDGNGGTDTETVTITITGTNDAPVITGGDTTGDVTELPDGDAGENTDDLTDSGTLNFADVDLTDSHTVSQSANGVGYLGTFAAVLGAGNTIDWDFSVNDSLLDSLGAGDTLVQSYDVTVDDGNGGTDTETVTITIQGTNDGPVANGDSFGGIEDIPVIGNVLGNDTDVDASDILNVVEPVIISANGGTVTMAPNGDFTYVPFEHFSGADSFTYTVSDGNGGTDTATVDLLVVAVADQPIIVALNAVGATDTAVPVPLTIDFPDEDGSEVHTITLSDVPANATFNNGTDNNDGTWTLTKADLVGLTINVAPPGPIFGSTFDLFDLTTAGGGDGSLGFVLDGSTGQDNNGFDVATAGDVNGDGFADILTSSVGGDSFGRTNSGEVTLYFGGTTHAAETIISATTPAQSYTFAGANAGDRMGTSVRSAGDLNNDGYDDIIIGSPLASPDGNVSGRSYVVFGSAGNANFAAMDADDGTVDGLIDLAQLQAADGGDGSRGFILNGSPVAPATSNEFTGYSTTGGFDFNGDGIDDMAIGATGNDFEDGVNPVALDYGATYLVFGKTTGFAAEIDVQDFMDPSNGAASAGTGDGSEGVVIRGFGVGDATGRQISGMQDMNGDGKDELLIGGRLADPNGGSSGQAYIVYGTDTLGAEFSLGDLDGTNGFIFNGMASNDRMGRSINEAGDINGDGINDIIIGSYRADGINGTDSGEAYVIFGGQTNLAALDALDGTSDGVIETSELATVNGGDGTLGFIISGAEAQDRVGHVVRNAGDLNGDGFDDVLVGAPKANPDGQNDEGGVYVVFGTNTGFAAEIDMGDFAAGDGTVGFEIQGINGGDNAGWSAGAAGDVNGDGFDDIVIGAHYADPNGASSGATYVIFGKQDLSGDDFVITVEATATETSNSDTASSGTGLFVDVDGSDEDTIEGTSYGDTLNGGAGNDTLTGNGGDDLFVFTDGTGDDVITDFTEGAGSEDVIDVSDFGFTDFADLLTATNDSGADTVITLDGDDSLTLIGVQEANLHEDDFLI
ncbi:MAG: VCBS domain-containing protein, partial [Alphaproteobacteria bacterium]